MNGNSTPEVAGTRKSRPLKVEGTIVDITYVHSQGIWEVGIRASITNFTEFVSKVAEILFLLCQDRLSRWTKQERETYPRAQRCLWVAVLV